MKTTIRITYLLLLACITFACGSDDETIQSDDNDQGEALEEQRATTLNILAGNDAKVWFIQSANLTNLNGSFDVSNQFNIKDDEFIFSGSITAGNLQWRPGHDINLDATSVASSAKDYYLEPQDYSFTFIEDSASQLTSIDGQFIFEVVDNETINGTITLSSRSQNEGNLTISLTPKAPENYRTPPQSGLNFTFVSSIEDETNFISETAGGMIGSYSDNSLFLVSRNDNAAQGMSEQILKYSLDTNNWTTNLYTQLQFVTKRLNIINNELVVFGGQIVSTYPLTPNGAPTSEFTHDLGLTRFGFSVQGDLGYFVGNNSETPDGAPAQIRLYNYLTNEIDNVTTLPKPRLYGGTEIVNNELFVFGGRNLFPAGTYDDLDAECFKVDLQTGNISSFNMPQLATMSYAARFENLIYVGYETRSDDDNDNEINDDDRTVHFAVYNTQNDSFTEIAHNLDDSDLYSSIHAITIFNGKLYVAYASLIGDPLEIKIFSAPL